MRFKTVHYSQVFTQDESASIFEYLRENIPWRNGIFSKKYNQVSHLGREMQPDSDVTLEWIIFQALSRCKFKNYITDFIYVNYYRDGDDFCSDHSHPDTVQMVISFNEKGGERTLHVGKKDYRLQNGDVIVFGSGTHGINKEEDRNGRISVATFMSRKRLINNQN